MKTASNPMGAAMDGVKDATRDLKDSLDPSKFDPESETGKLAAKRASDAKKIEAATARKAAERKAREAEEALAYAKRAEAELAAPPADAAAPSSSESKT
jgi:sec-independent protein translocase protein TatB